MARHNRITSISTIQASLYELSQHVLTVQQKIRVLNQEVQELKENREQEIGTSNLDSIPPAAAHDDMEVAELDEIELEGMELENLQTEPVELENDTATQFYRVMMDAISGLYDCVSSIDISPEYVCSALVRPYNLPTCERMLERWENFKRHGVVDIKYCLSGILYWGHDDHDSPFSGVALGECHCMPDLSRQNDVPINRSTRCIRVKRDGKKDGKLCFSLGIVL